HEQGVGSGGQDTPGSVGRGQGSGVTGQKSEVRGQRNFSVAPCRTFDLRPSTFDLRPSTFDLRPSTFDLRPSPHQNSLARAVASFTFPRPPRRPFDPMPARRTALAPRALLTAAPLALLLVALAVHPLAADDEAPLETRTQAAINEILNEPDLPSAIWGIHVRDLESGRTVYSHNADKNLIPASNLKLFTTAAALDVLGPDYRY